MIGTLIALTVFGLWVFATYRAYGKEKPKKSVGIFDMHYPRKKKGRRRAKRKKFRRGRML